MTKSSLCTRSVLLGVGAAVLWWAGRAVLRHMQGSTDHVGRASATLGALLTCSAEPGVSAFREAGRV